MRDFVMSGLNSTISENAITQFSELVHVRQQQHSARLQPFCKLLQMKGKAMAYEGMGTVELAAIDGRHQAVEFSEMEHWRRKISKRRFGATLAVDRTDLEERLTDPTSGYADALAMAAKRQFDRVVVAAMFADVTTGEDFDGTVTFANDGGTTVDATGGLTYEKLLEIHQNFIDAEVGNDMDVKFCMGITGDEHTDLMSELELTSGDYSREYVVDKGTISRASGIELIKFAASGAGGADAILPVVTGVRTSFCMAENAIAVGIGRSWTIEVQPRNDLYDTTQIKITGVLGAVRTEGKLIQKVTTTD
jgi:hypothetical protein